MLILCTRKRQNYLNFQEFRYGLILATDKKAEIWSSIPKSGDKPQKISSKFCRPNSYLTEYQLQPKNKIYSEWDWSVQLEGEVIRVITLYHGFGWSVGIFNHGSSIMVPLQDFNPEWVDTLTKKPTVWDRLVGV